MLDDIPMTPHCFQNHLGLWSIQADYLTSALAAIRAGTWRADIEAAEKLEAKSSAEPRPYGTMRGGIAVIDIVGPMMKGFSKFGGASTVFARRALRAAVEDDEVSGIMLRVDSPGGHVAGTQELADDVQAARQSKPVHTFVEDLAASAAYWVASQSGHITTNRTGQVGSIGVLLMVDDTSKKNEMDGITTHVVTTGEFKATGHEGVPITDRDLAYLQDRVNSTHAHFLDAVSTGRGLDGAQLAAAADGRVFSASTAQSMGLIDAVGSFGDAARVLAASIAQRAAETAGQAAVKKWRERES